MKFLASFQLHQPFRKERKISQKNISSFSPWVRANMEWNCFNKSFTKEFSLKRHSTWSVCVMFLTYIEIAVTVIFFLSTNSSRLFFFTIIESTPCPLISDRELYFSAISLSYIIFSCDSSRSAYIYHIKECVKN